MEIKLSRGGRGGIQLSDINRHLVVLIHIQDLDCQRHILGSVLCSMFLNGRLLFIWFIFVGLLTITV